jgi:hypothetical protein
MKTKNMSTIVALCFVFSLTISTLQSFYIIPVNATDRAALMWGTSANYADPEKQASEDASAMIEWLFNDNGEYNYVQDYWGSSTQQYTFYSEVSDCARYYDYATFYYKGHSWWHYDCDCGYLHVSLWDNEGCQSYNELLDDDIHQNAYRDAGCQSKIFRFVNLWSCSNNWTGSVNSTHCAGMIGAWFNRTDLSLDAYPYAGSDDSDVCYLGFDGISMDFSAETEYSSYTYEDFCVQFYVYALHPLTYTIRLSLYYSSYDTIGCSYLLSDLYQGYTISGIDSRQVLYGDAHEDLPD